MKVYTLKEVAKIIGVTTETLRNWDRKGLITATRTLGNQRRISEEEVERIKNFKK